MMSLKSPTALQSNIIHVVPPSTEVARYICPELSPKDEYLRNFDPVKNDGFISQALASTFK